MVITGSSGLIGAALASRLDREYDEVGFDRPGEPHPPAHTDCIDLDVTSDDSVRAEMRQLRERHGDRVESVVHLTAYYDFSGEPSDLYEKVTVEGRGGYSAGCGTSASGSSPSPAPCWSTPRPSRGCRSTKTRRSTRSGTTWRRRCGPRK